MITRLFRVDAVAPDSDAIAEAARVLLRGGLVAFPTETVYGLGAHALDADAVAAIFAAKGRPSNDPVIVHLASHDQLTTVARAIPPAARRLADAFWPGALTLILEKQDVIPERVTAGLPTVGVRVPSHPVARDLLHRAGVPIAAPSANRFSRPSPTTAEHVLADLDGRIDLILDGGPASIGVESTILDLTTSPPLVRRPGGVPLTAIHAIVPDARLASELIEGSSPLAAPGQLLRHYAPHARLTLYVGSVERVAARVGDDARTAIAAGQRVGILAPAEDLSALAPRLAAVGATGRVVTERYGSRRDPAAAAHDLFAALRRLDAAGVEVILATSGGAGDLETAIVDRLTRAAEGRVVRVD